MNSDVHPTGPGFRRSLLLFVVSFIVIAARPASAAKPGKDETRAMKRELTADDPSAKPKNRDGAADVRERKDGAADLQARALARVREQMEITDDGEWALIAERIGKVDELRRALLAGNGGPRGFAAPGDRGKRASAAAPAGLAERDALRAAVKDKLPDAELKGRLARAREVQTQQESRLATAQAELRAVLTVRQEAVAVVMGLLPP